MKRDVDSASSIHSEGSQNFTGNQMIGARGDDQYSRLRSTSRDLDCGQRLDQLAALDKSIDGPNRTTKRAKARFSNGDVTGEVEGFNSSNSFNSSSFSTSSSDNDDDGEDEVEYVEEDENEDERLVEGDDNEYDDDDDYDDEADNDDEVARSQAIDRLRGLGDVLARAQDDCKFPNTGSDTLIASSSGSSNVRKMTQQYSSSSHVHSFSSPDGSI